MYLYTLKKFWCPSVCLPFLIFFITQWTLIRYSPSIRVFIPKSQKHISMCGNNVFLVKKSRCFVMFFGLSFGF